MTETSMGARTTETIAITELLHRFAWTADVDTVEEFTRYFTEDAEWHMGETVWSGHAAIVEGLGSMRQAGFSGPEVGTRHLMHDIDVVDVTDDSARVRSLYTLVSPGEAPAILSIGMYQDELVRGSQGWLIQRRAVSAL